MAILVDSKSNVMVGELPDLGVKETPKIPAKVYNFVPPVPNPFGGGIPTHLEENTDFKAPTEKVYGDNPRKCEKIFKTYQASTRNLGVILHGNKGTGKSVLLHMISAKAVELGYPVILINDATQAMPEFIKSLKQDVVVIIDEFDKIYNFEGNDENRGSTPQEDLLTMFDGGDTASKNLYIIACNELGRLNSYLLNRPGRFNYLFRVVAPNPGEVAEYMNDKLLIADADEKSKLITDVSALASTNSMSYDCLRAIANELNLGYGLNETLEDLNITINSTYKQEITVKMTDGSILCFNTGTLQAGKNKNLILRQNFKYVKANGIICSKDEEIYQFLKKQFAECVESYAKDHGITPKEARDQHYDDLDFYDPYDYNPAVHGSEGLRFDCIVSTEDIKFGQSGPTIDKNKLVIRWDDRNMHDFNTFPEAKKNSGYMVIDPSDIEDIQVRNVEGSSDDYYDN